MPGSDCLPYAVFDPRPSLWAETGSPLAPWADVTLTCQSPLPTQEFQLLKNGVGQEPVHLESPAHEHRFPLGPVTSATRGLYRCRYKGNNDWVSPSNLVDVTGAGECGPRPGGRRRAAGEAPLLTPHPPCALAATPEQLVASGSSGAVSEPSVPICKIRVTGLPWRLSSKESTCQCRRGQFNPWVGKTPWRRAWQPAPVSLPGESHGQRSLAGYSPWGATQLDRLSD